MLTRIDLRDFKCFPLLKLPLRRLTLLSGANASGKSSVIQALVLLHQAMREHECSSNILLNGNTIRLGTAGDVINQIHGRRAFGISLLEHDGSYVQWEFGGELRDTFVAVKIVRMEFADGADGEAVGSSPLHYLLPRDTLSVGKARSLADRLRQLTYLGAQRLGPREICPLEDRRQLSGVGPQGQYTLSVLYSRAEERVLKGLATDGTAPTLLRQAQARMDRFFPGCEFVVERVPAADAVTLRTRTSGSMDFSRAVHTGDGLVQVLPIVVAALSAAEDRLLLIENPEANLHPAGQARVGEFLAEVAAAGVRVILETHSDHVLNGIRRAVKQSLLCPDDVAIHFFRPRSDDDVSAAQVQQVMLDRNGNMHDWPDGFFDQFDKDMNYFAGWS